MKRQKKYILGYDKHFDRYDGDYCTVEFNEVDRFNTKEEAESAALAIAWDPYSPIEYYIRETFVCHDDYFNPEKVNANNN